jgi:pyruvate dehydrogenase kinase 2/3/4
MRGLPQVAREHRYMQTVIGHYRASFEELAVGLPLLDENPFHESAASSPGAAAYTEALNVALPRILKRHESVVLYVTAAFRELMDRQELPPGNPAIAMFLDRFFLSRIGVRFLFRQHLHVAKAALTALRDASAAEARGTRWTGAIDSKCDVAAVAADAVVVARQMCSDAFGVAPAVDIVTPTAHGAPILFTYVPSHMYYILVELLKNACRATYLTHGTLGRTLPPVSRSWAQIDSGILTGGGADQNSDCARG